MESRVSRKWNIVDDLPEMPDEQEQEQEQSPPRSLRSHRPDAESGVVPVSLRTLDFNV